MRVIAGKYRGRRLNSPIGDDVRPTTDKIKEALFNILQGDVEDAVVVDLFAGTGGLGIEALSRGAKKVYFCDIDNRSIALLKSNLTFVDKNEYEVIKGDFADCIRRLALRGVKADIIICDPPYGLKKGEELLKVVKEAGILNNNGVVTIERASEDGALPDREFFLYDTKKYGNISIDIFRNFVKCAVTGTFDPFTNGHYQLVKEGLDRFGAVYVVILINPDKECLFTVEDRVKIIEASLKDFKKRVRIEFFDGFTVDYCAQRGIKFIIRGVRNESDLSYEKEMADYNKTHGGVETIIIDSDLPEVSSTGVRARIANGEDVSDRVRIEALPYIMKGAHNAGRK